MGIFTFLGELKNVLKIILNTFSRTRYDPRTLRERNRMIFSKGEQITVSLWRFYQETNEKFENISLMFSSCNPFHPNDMLPNAHNKSFRELVEN